MSETEIRCDHCRRACTAAEQASGWCDHCRSRPIEAGSAVSLNSQFAEAEAAARHARLLREAAEWTEMLARDGIRFDEQPVMDPVPPLYFWLGKDAPA